MVVTRINHGKQTEMAKQALLTYIWENRLAKGDRIPSQKELRENIPVGGATIDRAVHALVIDGVLSAKSGVGVFVEKPQPFGHPGYSVGLAGLFMNHFSISLAALAQAAETQLHRHGCRCLQFPHHEVSPNFYRDLPLSSLPGLQETIAQGEISGLLTLTILDKNEWVKLEKNGIKTCYFGMVSSVPCGVIIDMAWYIREAMNELLASGVKRPKILIGPMNGEQEQEILESIRDIAAEFDIPDHSQQLSDIFIKYGYESYIHRDFRTSAHEILSFSPEKRPDGLILCDDMMSMMFFSELIRLQGRTIEYIPRVVSMQNREFNLELPADNVTVYWNNLSKIGQMAVELLLGRLSGKIPEQKVIRCRPVREV